MSSNSICGFTDIQLPVPDIMGDLYHAEMEEEESKQNKSNCIKNNNNS